MSLITLLTDFGEQDGYTGAMKGVIYGIDPSLTVVDISHKIPPGDITAAAFVLNSTYGYFPAGTIHVIVVDPGVGSERKALCMVTAEYTFIAPDNGVLQWISKRYPDALIYSIENDGYFHKPVSHTFHGRDIFAPVAAHLSRGVAPETLGPQLDRIQHGVMPECLQLGDILTGEVVYIDHFGNLISNIPEKFLQGKPVHSIHIGNTVLRTIDSTYSSVLLGYPLALVGSHGMLEIAVRGGNAAECLNINKHSRILVQFIGNPHE